MNNKPSGKRFCKHGHDTFICGRDAAKRCKECRRREYKPTKYCPKGHDKDVFGRTKKGNCKVCQSSIKKQFCPKGHDIFKFGRYKNGHCRMCDIEKYVPVEVKKGDRQFCVNGHDTFIVGRYKNKKCKECVRLRDKKSYIPRKRKSSPFCRRNHDKRILGMNSRGGCSECVRLYDKVHPEIHRLARLKSDTNRKLRIPNWGQEGILEFYANCSKQMTVDHIIPLQGKKVSGLHVSWNLQYLTRSQNSNKHNKVNLIDISLNYGVVLEKLGLKI